MRRFIALVLCLLLSGIGSAQIPQGAKIFIAPMQGNLDGFITAEILKQHLKVVLITDVTNADYVMTGMNVKEDNHWYNSVWGGKDKNEGNVTLIKVQDKSIVWAMDAGDRSLFFSAFKKGGLSKVASRIVQSLKRQIPKN